MRIALAAVLLLASAATADARHHHRHADADNDAAGQNTPGQTVGPAAFDFYMLTLSVAPSFCALSGTRSGKRECANPNDATYRDTPLTVHGLWPNRAFKSVNLQPSECSTVPLGTLPEPVASQLRHYMPGTADGLDRYEWRKHGTCSGLSPAVYFSDLVAAARQANATIGAVIRDRGWFGQSVNVQALLDAVGETNPALARAIVVNCRFPRRAPGAKGDRTALIAEIRVLLSKDLSTDPEHDGWPGSFVPVDTVGFRANSGCPGGAGFLPGGYAASP